MNKYAQLWFITAFALLIESHDYQGNIWDNHDYPLIAIFMLNGFSLVAAIYVYLFRTKTL